MSSKAERTKQRHEKVLSMYRGYINELERAYKNHDDQRVSIAYARLSAYTQGVYEMSQGGECRYYRKQFDEIFNHWKEENERLIGKHIAERTEWWREY